MLRITEQPDVTGTTLRVEGRLVPPWVHELETCWEHNVESGRPLVVDLRYVTFVGVEGKELLARIYRSGAKLLTSGTAMSAMVEQLDTHSNREGR